MAAGTTESLRRLLEQGMSENDASVIDELVSPEYLNHDAPVPVHGPEGFKQLVGMFKGGFPDLRVEVEETYADGNKVGSRGTITGTHRGEFMGVPATNRSINVKYLDLWRVEDGRFVETWVQMDTMGLMQQLGVLPVTTG
jgi:predicted ester cyclase